MKKSKKFLEITFKEKPFSLAVDYSKRYREMIKDGFYDEISQKILNINPKKSEERLIKKTGRLFAAGIQTEKTIKKMDLKGYRPANIFEFLTFGSLYPEIQKFIYILTYDEDLGSEVIVLDHFYLAPIVGGDNPLGQLQRRLATDNFCINWPGKSRRRSEKEKGLSKEKVESDLYYFLGIRNSKK